MSGYVNIDKVLETFNEVGVAYLLIGGMNFMLRHDPVLTFDIDLWIEDTTDNLVRCEKALAELEAEWGETEADWGPVTNKPSNWLTKQAVFSLNSPHGAIDIFRRVQGLGSWQDSFRSAQVEATKSGIKYYGISDADMLRCQLALDEAARKTSRVTTLERKLNPRS
jgi:hypothetical protein